MASETGIRVLLVDHHVAARCGCALVLTQAGGIDIVAEAEDAEDAYHLAATRDVDVVVLELALPGISGLWACAQIDRRCPDARILVFSRYEQPLFLRRALAAGATGYMSKRARADELVEAVRAVAAGSRWIEPRLDEANTGPEPLEALSAREFEIFRLFADGYDTHEIAAVLFLSAKTVANNATGVRAKLGGVSAVEWTRTALHYGVIEL